MMFQLQDHSESISYKTMLAKHKCLQCGYEWESRPGPTQCPLCNHLYIKWVNYDEMRKMWDDREKIKNKV